MPILLSIENQLREFEGDAVHIGADPANDINFRADRRLQKHHAVIKKVATRWLVEGVEGTLIQVGDEPEGRMHWLSAGDVIRLTPAGPDITFVSAHAAAAASKGTPVRRQLVDRIERKEHGPQSDVGPMEFAEAPPTPADRSAPQPRPVQPLNFVSADDDDDDGADLPTFGRTPRPMMPSIDDIAPAELAELVPRPPATKPPSRVIEPDGPAAHKAVPVAPVDFARDTPSANVEPPRLQVRPLPSASVVVTPIPRAAQPELVSKPAPEQPKVSLLSGLLGMVFSIAVACYVWYPYLGWEFGSSTDVPARSKRASKVVEVEPDDAEEPEESEENGQESTMSPPARPVQAEPLRQKPALLSAREINAALAIVGVEQPGGQQRFRLGTAWVAGSKKLVTTASIAMAIDELEAAGARPVVCFADGRTMAVARRVVHPQYRVLAGQLAQQRALLNAQATLAGEQHLADLRKRQVDVDIALMLVAEELPAGLVPSAPTKQAAENVGDEMDAENSGRLTGFPFSVDDFHLTDTAPRPVIETGELTRANGRLGFVVPRSRSALNWAGSAVLNADRQVIGICSGPDLDPASAEVQAVTPVERLRDLDPQWK